MGSFFFASGIMLLLSGSAGLVIRLLHLCPYSLDVSQFQYSFYASSIFDWKKYPVVFGGLVAGCWWKMLLAGLFLVISGHIIKKYSGVLNAVSKHSLTGFSRFIYIVLLIVYPVFSVIIIAPMHLKLLHGLENPFSYIANYGIFHIPWGQNYRYYNAVSIIFLNVCFSIYFLNLWKNILKIPSDIRRLPGIIFFGICMILALLSVVVYYPVVSFIFPLVLVICFFVLLGNGFGSGSRSEEEKDADRIAYASSYVQLTGTTRGLSSSDIDLLNKSASSGELLLERKFMLDSLEESNSGHTVDDEILYRKLK